MNSILSIAQDPTLPEILLLNPSFIPAYTAPTNTINRLIITEPNQ